MMNRKNFGGASGIIIDYCKGHGFWFDNYELEKVVAFVRSGGLEKARQLEIARSKEELERLRSAQKSLASTPRGYSWSESPPQAGDWILFLGEVGARVFGWLAR